MKGYFSILLFLALKACADAVDNSTTSEPFTWPDLTNTTHSSTTSATPNFTWPDLSNTTHTTASSKSFVHTGAKTHFFLSTNSLDFDILEKKMVFSICEFLDKK